MAKKEKKEKVENALWRAYVRITDSNIYEKLRWLEDVKKVKISNAIPNALYYGLDEYIKAEFGEIEVGDVEEHKPTTEPSAPIVIETIADRRIEEIVSLLEEIVLNTTLTKSIVASLFNERAKNLYGYSVRPELFDNGDLRDTPDYLVGHEKMVMRKIQEERRKNR